MSDGKDNGDDLDAMLREMEAEAGAEGGGDVSDDEMAELEKMLSESPSPREEADAAKAEAGDKPTLADEMDESELADLELDDVPDEDPSEAELPEDVDVGGQEAPDGKGAGGEKGEDASNAAGGTEPSKSGSSSSAGQAAPAEEQATKQKPSEQQKAASVSTDGEAEQSQQTEESSGGTTDESSGWGAAIAWGTVKWTAYSVPTVALCWLIGAYMGRWITAGWLLGLVSVLASVGVPLLVYDAVGRRGQKRWWLAGSGVLLTAVLVAPMPESAGNALAHHGYWPGQMADEIALSDNNVVSRASSTLSRTTAGWLGVTVASDADYTALGQPPAAADKKKAKSGEGDGEGGANSSAETGTSDDGAAAGKQSNNDGAAGDESASDGDDQEAQSGENESGSAGGADDESAEKEGANEKTDSSNSKENTEP